MAEGTTKFQRLVSGTTAFWYRHKPRPGSNTVLVGGYIGSAGVIFEIVEKGINGQPLNIWHAIKLAICFTMSCAKSWELWMQQPPGPRSYGHDPEGHLKP